MLLEPIRPRSHSDGALRGRNLDVGSPTWRLWFRERLYDALRAGIVSSLSQMPNRVFGT